MNNFHKNITFIIVTFKSENIIEKCLKRIPKNCRIIIVENSNNFFLKKKIKKKFPKIKFLINKKNFGYGKANNIGILNTKTKYAFILNPDAVLKKNTIFELKKAIQFLSNDFAIISPNLGNNYGYFNVSPQSQCFPNCDYLLNIIEKKNISKSHNWFILNRKLVENLCFNKDELLNTHYKDIYAPAEYFYYTFIKILNLEDEIITTENLANDATTFTNWQGMEYKYPSNFELKNYDSISRDELLYLINSKCFFARKFNIQCILDLFIEEYIHSIKSKICDSFL
jgi:glycosyltransferase involved in cell wall biosynthesis